MSALEPVKVQVVRDDANAGQTALLAVALVWLKAWALMLLIPFITTWHPSYWQCVAIVIALAIVRDGHARWASFGVGSK